MTVHGPERRGPERPGPDYPPEWDNEPEECDVEMCGCGAKRTWAAGADPGPCPFCPAAPSEPAVDVPMSQSSGHAPAEAQQDDERCRYGHTEADHDAVGACQRPSLDARGAASATEYPRGSDLAVAFERGWDARQRRVALDAERDAALAARPSADTETLRARVEALAEEYDALASRSVVWPHMIPTWALVNDLRAALDGDR